MRDPRRDRCEDAVQIRHYVCIAETDHVVTFIVEEAGANRVPLLLCRVVVPIHLDDQTCRM